MIAVQRAKGTNEKALHDLYAAHFKHFNTHRFEVSREGRASQYWHYAHGGVAGIAEYKLPFLRWKIPEDVTIRLPRSTTLPHLLKGDEKSQSRIIRFGVEHPDFSRLDLVSDRLSELAADLEDPVTKLRKKVLPVARKSLSFLLSAERVFSLIEGAIPDTAGAWITHHGDSHVELHGALSSAIDRATKLLVAEPTFFDKPLQRDVNGIVDDVLSVLTDVSNMELLERLAPLYDVAEEQDVAARRSPQAHRQARGSARSEGVLEAVAIVVDRVARRGRTPISPHRATQPGGGTSRGAISPTWRTKVGGVAARCRPARRKRPRRRRKRGSAIAEGGPRPANVRMMDRDGERDLRSARVPTSADFLCVAVQSVVGGGRSLGVLVADGAHLSTARATAPARAEARRLKTSRPLWPRTRSRAATGFNSRAIVALGPLDEHARHVVGMREHVDPRRRDRQGTTARLRSAAAAANRG